MFTHSQNVSGTNSFVFSKIDYKTEPLRHNVHFEISGNTKDPILVILGGISASKHVAANSFNPNKGWWEEIVGEDKALNPKNFCIISIDFLDIPNVTTHLQAQCVAALLEYLNIKNIYAFIGYSYGGMVALAFAEYFPSQSNQFVILGAAHNSVPQTYALRVIQQKIVELGINTSQEKESLSIARQLGCITYRSSSELNSRFTNDNSQSCILSYLNHQGVEFSERFNCDKFLTLSKSLNNHSVDLSKIKNEKLTFIVSNEDQITPPAQVKECARSIGKGMECILFNSIYGHDAYLKETDQLKKIFNKLL